MTATTPYPVLLAHDITHRIDQLTDHLRQASPEEAAQIMEPVLDSEEGILGRLSCLLATASRYAKGRAASSPARELWQDLARAANRLHDLSLDLETQTDEFALLTDTLASNAAPAPATNRPPGPLGGQPHVPRRCR